MRLFLPIQTLFFVLLLSTAHAATRPDYRGAEPREIDRIVAVVNDGVILESELQSFLAGVKAQIRSRGANLPPEDVLRRQALERLVMQKLQLQTAEETGIRVDDETLNQAVLSIAQRNNMSLDQFRRALEADGYSFAQFRENIRDEILIGRLQQRNVDERIQVSDQEIDNLLANQRAQVGEGKTYHLRHILVAVPEAASPEQIQAARDKAERVLSQLRGGADFRQTAIALSDGQQALEGGDLGWFPEDRLPSLFSDVVPKLEPGQVSDLLRSPSGFHIVQLAEAKGTESHIVRQTHARHILLRTNEVLSDEAARTRLEQLRSRIIGGDDFADLAKAHSDDPLSARQGGDLGWLNPGDTDPNFEEAMDQLPVGAVSEPFKTRFGWHLLQVLDRREQDDTKEFQRSQAREQIRARKRQEALELWLRRLRDEAYVETRLES